MEGDVNSIASGWAIGHRDVAYDIPGNDTQIGQRGSITTTVFLLEDGSLGTADSLYGPVWQLSVDGYGATPVMFDPTSTASPITQMVRGDALKLIERYLAEFIDENGLR